VGQFYEDFQPVPEERVRELLAAAQPAAEQQPV
jgi:predicted phosphoribosyltransferase